MLEAKIQRCALVACLFFVFMGPLFGQQRVQLKERILFYNCENLFDPADDPEHQDDEFTPQGDRHWTSFRQYQKMTNLSRVIVGAGEGRAPMLIGLAEVENDSVMLRLTRGTPLREWDYHYLITRSPDRRGINVALLYQPSDFRLLSWQGVRITMPDGARPTRDLLHASGRLVGGDTLDVVVGHLPSRLGGARISVANRLAAHRTIRHLYDSLLSVRRCPHVIIMGDMNDYPTTRSLRRNMRFGEAGLTNLMLPLQKELMRGRRPYGSHKYQGEWGFLDQFWVNEELLSGPNWLSPSDTVADVVRPPYVWIDNVDVVHFDFMLTEDVTHLGHRPLRSYLGVRYEGGYSDHLPIRLDLHVEY